MNDGCDFYNCHQMNGWIRENLYNRTVTGFDLAESLELENITIPGTTYEVFETKDDADRESQIPRSKLTGHQS